jgi:hypothetical protein
MKIAKGDYVQTPRFLKVKINEVFEDNNNAIGEGFLEPTGFRDEEYHVRGKYLGENRMIFAAIKR